MRARVQMVPEVTRELTRACAIRVSVVGPGRWCGHRLIAVEYRCARAGLPRSSPPITQPGLRALPWREPIARTLPLTLPNGTRGADRPNTGLARLGFRTPAEREDEDDQDERAHKHPLANRRRSFVISRSKEVRGTLLSGAA
jgi:hypothetical protein